MIFACWLSRGRSSIADCAWINVPAKTIAMNTGVSAKFLRIGVPPGLNSTDEDDQSLDAKPARLLAQASSLGKGQLAFQLCVHGDFCVEQFGDGAAFFGVFGCFLELGFVGARNLDLHLQMGRGDSKAGIKFFQRYGSSGVNGLRRHSGISELA